MARPQLAVSPASLSLRVFDPVEDRPQDRERTHVTIGTTFGPVMLHTRAWTNAEWDSIPRADRPKSVLHFPGVGVVEYFVG